MSNAEWLKAADDLLRSMPSPRGPDIRHAAKLLQDAYLYADELVQTLEIIAVSGSTDPIRDAGDALVKLGYWDAEELEQHRSK